MRINDHHVVELRARLVEWDVLGVYQDEDGPDDDYEYDDLIWPILRWLEDGVDARALSAHIDGILRRSYGLDGESGVAQTAFAQSLVQWWESSVGSHRSHSFRRGSSTTEEQDGG